MNQQNVGINNIKAQIFSFSGTVDRVRFFISSIVTLPIITLSSYILLICILEMFGNFRSGEYIMWAIASASVSINILFLWIFISFLIRRLNDLKLDKIYAWLIAVPVVNVIFYLALIFVKGIESEIQ